MEERHQTSDQPKEETSMASLGGRASAASLTREQRRDRAKLAAAARWKANVPQASHQGTIEIGGLVIPCAVLEDETRVVTQRGVFVSLGRHKNPSTGPSTIDERPGFLAAKNLDPFISEELRRSWNPIQFRLKEASGGLYGNIAYGYRATILPLVCRVFLDADAAGALRGNQKHIAVRARILLGGLATVGIVALVDAATGFEKDRARDALAKILEAFVAKELRDYVRTFDPEYYIQICRLKGWDYKTSTQRPRYLGKITNDIVYSRLAPGVLADLRRKNPIVKDGRRDAKHFQWLTENKGHPELQKHLQRITGWMEMSETWEEFYDMLNKHKPKYDGPTLWDIRAPDPRD